MNLHFRKVTEKNYFELIGLEVKEGQKDNFFFGSTKPNVMSLAQAHVIGGVVLAVYLENEMVGAYITIQTKRMKTWRERRVSQGS